MGCCNCRYLKASDKKDGYVNGCVYLCTKQKKYVNGASDACDKYERDTMRRTYESDEIYKNGKLYYDDHTSPSTYLLIFAILVIAAIIVNIFA